MSAATERARELLTKANETRTEGAIGFLVLAVEALIEELETHQHTYAGPPPGLPFKWLRTSADRDVSAADHAAYQKQKAAAKEAS